MEPRLAFLNIGPFEFLLLAAAAVMLFGADLPAVARKVGVMLGRMRSIAADLTRRIDTPPELERLHGELREGSADLEDEVRRIDEPLQQKSLGGEPPRGSPELRQEEDPPAAHGEGRTSSAADEDEAGAADRPA